MKSQAEIRNPIGIVKVVTLDLIWMVNVFLFIVFNVSINGQSRLVSISFQRVRSLSKKKISILVTCSRRSNEVYSEGKSACGDACDKIGVPCHIYTLIAVKGCTCREGYARHNKQCIKITDPRCSIQYIPSPSKFTKSHVRRIHSAPPFE